MLVDVRLGPVEALPAHLDFHTRRQRVDHGDTHAVQTAGNRVTAAAELAAGMQLGHHRFDTGDAFARHDVDRDASTVVDHPDAVVRQDGHFDMGGEAGESLIHRVVDNFVDQMMQASRTGRTDIHARADTHRFEAFQHAQVAGVVMVRRQRIVKLGVLELIVGDGVVDFVVEFGLGFSAGSRRFPGLSGHIGVQRISFSVCHSISFPCPVQRPCSHSRYTLERK